MRSAWLEEKRRQTQSLAEVELHSLVPSRRAFLHFVSTHKHGIAVIARLERCDPMTGGEWAAADLIRLAQIADDAEVGAIAVRTAALFAVEKGEMEKCAAAVSAPVLCDDLCLDAKLIYHARLRGADAVVIPCAEAGAGRIAELVDITASLHMAAVVEVCTRDHLAVALDCPHAAIGLNCADVEGFMDVEATGALARSAPPRRLTLTLAEPRTIDDVARLSGAIDAAVIGALFLGAADPGAAMRSAVEALA
jgi:indole-3-glycerol phosphate synthase